MSHICDKHCAYSLGFQAGLRCPEENILFYQQRSPVADELFVETKAAVKAMHPEVSGSADHMETAGPTMKERKMKEKSGSGTPSSSGTDFGRRTMLKSAALVVGAGAAMPSWTCDRECA